MTAADLRELATFLSCHGKLRREDRPRYAKWLLDMAHAIDGASPPDPKSCNSCLSLIAAHKSAVIRLKLKLSELRSLAQANEKDAAVFNGGVSGRKTAPISTQSAPTPKPRRRGLSVREMARLQSEIPRADNL